MMPMQHSAQQLMSSPVEEMRSAQSVHDISRQGSTPLHSDAMDDEGSETGTVYQSCLLLFTRRYETYVGKRDW